jgi:ribose transport system ATP-binding protein
VRRRALEAIGHFDHPEIRPNIRASELSVSARQLVEIGRALAVGCRVLVLDEPTSSLSQTDIQRLFEIIRDLKKRGLAIVYISHFLEEVKSIADRLTVLRDGQTIGTRAVAEVTPDEIVRLMVGREIQDLYSRSPRQPGKTLLEVENLSGRKKPLSASLTLQRGEVLGICGLIGAGRTELLRTIFGLDAVKSGRIKIGAFIGPASPLRHWLQGMGMLSENRKEEGLALNLSITDNITLSPLRRGSFGSAGLVLPKKQQIAAQKWIQRLDIRCRQPEQIIGELSGGNQQKAALARLLQHDVDILLLDEPTRGIDVAAKALIYKVIDELAAGQNQPPKAVLMISSYLPELLGVCDRIAVMHRGRLGPARPAAEWTEPGLIAAAASGRAA